MKTLFVREVENGYAIEDLKNPSRTRVALTIDEALEAIRTLLAPEKESEVPQ